jgi:hypothetical protein
LDAPTEGGTKGQARTYPGSRVLKFDFPSFKVGVAEYEEGPTGCTVFHFPEGAATAIDVRGGNVGKIGDYEFNHAICLAGGSLPGLEAAAELWDRGAFARGHAACFGRRREEWIEIGAMEALRERCGKKHSQPTTVSSVSNSWTWPSTAASLRLLAVGRRRAEARWIRENKASNARRRWTLRAYPDPRRAA